jgi:hypothetical protein
MPVTVNSFVKGKVKYHENFVRENYQRNQIARGIQDASDNDLIIVSDVDEIPNFKAPYQGAPNTVDLTTNLDDENFYKARSQEFSNLINPGAMYGNPNASMPSNSESVSPQAENAVVKTDQAVDNSGSKRFNLNNASRYAAPLYNTALGMTKPEYPTMENVSFKLNTNPEKLLLPSRIRAARNKYSMLKNQANGNLTVAQRMGILNSVGSDFNNDLQSIYGNFAASEANTQNSNNQIINQQDAMNREINYKNADAKLRAKSANRNLVSTGLSQLTDIGQLNTKNKNQMAVDELRTLIYKDIIPNVGNSKAAQTILKKLNQLGYNSNND